MNERSIAVRYKGGRTSVGSGWGFFLILPDMGVALLI